MKRITKDHIERTKLFGDVSWKAFYLYDILAFLEAVYPDTEEFTTMKNKLQVECPQICNSYVYPLVPEEPETLTLNDFDIDCIPLSNRYTPLPNFIDTEDAYDSYNIVEVEDCQENIGDQFKYVGGEDYFFNQWYNTAAPDCTTEVHGLKGFSLSEVTGYNLVETSPKYKYVKKTLVEGYRPNTVFYVNVPTENLTNVQINALKVQINAWFNSLNVLGKHLVSNIIRNDEIPGQTSVPTRTNNLVSQVQGVIYEDSFVTAPIIAALRHSYSIDEAEVYPNMDALKDFAKEYSYVCINLNIDNITPYAASYDADTYLPQAISDYTLTIDFINDLDSVQVHTAYINTPNSDYLSLVQAMSFMEVEKLTSSEINGFLGTDKVAHIGTNYNAYTDSLMTKEPYKAYPKLKDFNYTVDYGIYLGTVASLLDFDFIGLLSPLEADASYYIEDVKEYEYDIIPEEVSCTFKTRILRGDAISNLATITVNYCAECTEPDCYGARVQYKYLTDGENWNLDPDYMQIESQISYIKITYISEGFGVYKYNEEPIQEGDVFSIDEIQDIVFIPYALDDSDGVKIIHYDVSVDGITYCHPQHEVHVHIQEVQEFLALSVELNDVVLTQCGNMVHYDLTGADYNLEYQGNINNLTYRWMLGGTQVNTDINTIDYTFTQNGSYTLIVEDNFGTVATDTMNISIDHFDSLVLDDYVDVILPQGTTTYTVTQDVLISNPDSIGFSVLWTNVSGGTSDIINGTTITPTFNNLTLNFVYLFEIAYTDTCLRQQTKILRIVTEAEPVNLPPIANAGADVTQHTTTYNVSASAIDPEGLPMTYSWVQVGGPVLTSILSTNQLNPTITGLTVLGTYTYELTVTDSEGQTSTDMFNIVIEEKPREAGLITPQPVKRVGEEVVPLSMLNIFIDSNNTPISIGDIIYQADNTTLQGSGNFGIIYNGVIYYVVITNGTVTNFM